MDIKCVNWTILVQLSNGTFRTISDMPDDVSMPLDEYLTELENNGEFNVKSKETKQNPMDNGDVLGKENKKDDKTSSDV
jgi:hypothetical protein|tara:strand:- start:3131 stop:3367 length:237 start_codon:yes stop_codon:yes gene_type:complete